MAQEAQEAWEAAHFLGPSWEAALVTCRPGRWPSGRRAKSGEAYPVVGMRSVIMEFPQWNVLRVPRGVHARGGACRYVVENEPESGFLVEVGTRGEPQRSAPASSQLGDGRKGPSRAHTLAVPQVSPLPSPTHLGGTVKSQWQINLMGSTLTTGPSSSTTLSAVGPSSRT